MRTQNYIVCGIVENVNIILDHIIAKYIFNVINSYNTTLTSLINTFLNCKSPVFAENYRYIMYKYNIPSTVWRSDVKTLISNISYIDGILYSGLTTQEIQVLIDFIYTEDSMPIP